MERLFHSRLAAPGLRLELYSDGGALVAVGLGSGSDGRLSRWLSRQFPGAEISPAGERHRAVERQLGEYLAGKRRVFDLDYELVGSDFQKEVWRAVSAIPYGCTASYGEIAHVIGRPDASRAVGAANGANPLPVLIPCHRVIGANGQLTGYGGGLPLKRRLLAMEGALPSPAVQMRLKWSSAEGETR